MLLGALLTILAMPVMSYAQEAIVTGTIVDSTGGVLPGVTVKAVNEASGNSFEAVTDTRGTYRIAVRIGNYQITATLAGFGTVTRSLELQVGQTTVLNLQLAPSNIQENVTVSAEPPLISPTTSSVSGNIDPRQMSELPVLGRNWMSLSLLAPGNRTNTQGSVPVQDRHSGDVREFELNIDGQQVTAVLGTGNQARYSKDSIAEFQFISNRFDATQGRSSGVQVNAITKSGTNTPSGSFVGNFRQQVQRDGSCAPGRRPLFGPAVVWNVRRPDCEEQASFLRELRLRAPAHHIDLEHAVHGLQHLDERRHQHQDGRPPAGLSALAADALHGEGQWLKSPPAVWRG